MPSFEWDDAKNQANIEKHGVDFSLACQIFAGPRFTVQDIRHDYGEVRYISIGKVLDVVLLTVIHTDRTGTIRLISARAASRKEREMYHEKIQKTDGA